MPSRKSYTTGQVARSVGVAPRTVAKWIDTGILPGYHIPGNGPRGDRRVQRDALMKFLGERGMPLPPLQDGFDVVYMIETNATLEGVPFDWAVRAVANPYELGHRIGSGEFPDVAVLSARDIPVSQVASYVGTLTRSVPNRPTIIVIGAEDFSAPAVVDAMKPVAFVTALPYYATPHDLTKAVGEAVQNRHRQYSEARKIIRREVTNAQTRG